MMKVYSVVDIVTCEECKRNKSKEFVDCCISEMYGKTLDNYCSLGDRRDTLAETEIICCKDCEAGKNIDEEFDWWECAHDKRILHGDAYCSWAEPKKNESYLPFLPNTLNVMTTNEKKPAIHCKDCLYYNGKSGCHRLFPYSVKYTSDNNTCRYAVRRRKNGTV